MDRIDSNRLGDRLAAGIHISFFALVATSGGKFLTAHGTDGRWGGVLALSVLLIIGYLLVMLSAGRGARHTVMVSSLLVVWAAAVLLASSFAWCALPLLFVCRGAYGRRTYYVVVGGVTLLTAFALIQLSHNVDWSSLVGPIAAAVLVTFMLESVDRDAERRVQLQADIAEAHRELAQSQHQAGVLAERDRLAKEIHDTVAQQLASGLLLLEASDVRRGDPSASRADVLAAASLVRTALAESRNLVHDLASPRSDPDGLRAAVLAAARAEVPDATLTVSGVPRIVLPEVAHAILRIAQSAAANVRQHAGDAGLGLTLSYLPDRVALDVFDTGIGFDPQSLPAPSPSGGYGLRAMRHRVEQLGGSLVVESTPGEGTVVAAQFPTDVEVAS